MTNATSKLGVSLVLLAVILAGCTTVTEPQTETTSATTSDGSASKSDAGREPQKEEKMEPKLAVIPTTFYFAFDQSLLTQKTQEVLKEHARRLRAKPSAIKLEGHADERGTREYNMALGERRALAVRDFLILHGVSERMITVVSYGEERPVAMGMGEESWSLNRRVELLTE